MSGAQTVADTRAQVLARIAADTRFALATHEHPDGDALGSLVAMHELLNALGKDSVMYVSSDDLPLPEEYQMFLLDGAIHQPPADIAERTVVFLDCGNIDRNSAAVLRDGAHLLNIDHHHDNTRFGTVNHVVANASCTAEIVWDLMHGLELRPSPVAAQALYVGLITDTGRFMYENTGPRAHEMAAELIEEGVDVADVYRRLYEEMPAEKLTLMALALDHLERYDEGELTVAALSAEDFARSGAREHYSEGIVDQLRAVRGTKVAVFVRELLGDKRGVRKVSLRATGDDVDVSAIARAQGGGGHRRAAGFSTELGLPELIAFLRPAVAQQLHAQNGDGPAAATVA
ncbi:MAG TPA: DHH family phosphoesterase [Solirubrobacteraceae bacterium]|nr:DHH family phosphoesterase [Solirubrobacteraceae bacterium]